MPYQTVVRTDRVVSPAVVAVHGFVTVHSGHRLKLLYCNLHQVCYELCHYAQFAYRCTVPKVMGAPVRQASMLLSRNS